MWWGKPSRPSAARLRQLYVEEEQSLREIGGLFKVSASTVTRWLEEAGIPRRGAGGRSDAPDADELRCLYVTRRQSTLDIARLYGVTPRAVSKWLSLYGIATRPPTEARASRLAFASDTATPKTVVGPRKGRR